MMPLQNIFANLPALVPGEIVQVLVQTPALRIEKIVSHGEASPEGFWYDLPQHEWVAVVRGEARLVFQGARRAVEMKAGDTINIPAHARHRVEWTTPAEPTVWLAVHYGDEPTTSQRADQELSRSAQARTSPSSSTST